jgi:predicted amidohydrolase YtcJ
LSWADKIFFGGKIYTMASEGEVAQAIAVRGDRIAAVGSDSELLQWEGEKEDLHGKTVIPGLIDSHIHTTLTARALNSVLLGDCESVADIVRKLKERAEKEPPGTWIIGIGFDHEKLAEKRMPNRFDLDLASAQHPIVISRCCLHIHSVNSLALKAAKTGENGESKELLDALPDGGLLGVIREDAIVPVLAAAPDIAADREAAKDMLEKTMLAMSATGLTGAHCLPGYEADSLDRIGLFQELESQGRLPLRVCLCFSSCPSFGIETGFGNSKIKYGFFKIFSDGSLGSRDAAMIEDYTDDPGNKGMLVHTQEELLSLMRKAHNNRIQIGIHAIGDRGVDEALTAFETIWQENPREGTRFRLIHASIVSESLIERMKRLPIVLDVQPSFMASVDLDWTDFRVGPRAKHAYPFKTFLREGIRLAGGSDCPVEIFNPFLGIHGAVNRQAADLHPEGGFHPEERISVYEAISVYTKGSAYAAFEEDEKGTIEKGKLADFVVLDRDPFEIEKSELCKVEVIASFLGGKLASGKLGQI